MIVFYFGGCEKGKTKRIHKYDGVMKRGGEEKEGEYKTLVGCMR